MNKKELKQKIIDANTAYRFGNAVMSDNEFDSLVEQFQSSSTKSEYDEFRNSLNEGISTAKVKHPFVMGSLDKLKYEAKADLLKFYEKYVKELNISAKVDGISCRLHYEDGKLTSASTRGNGEFGEDITDKIKYVKCVPQVLGTGKVSGVCKKIDIRGELVILKDDFAEMTGFANPRNACAGIMNRKEWTKDDVSKVTFVAYTILGPNFEKEEQFALLSAWKSFKVAWNMTFSSHYYFSDRKLDLAEELYKYATQDFEYETDGLVLCDRRYKNEAKYRPDACVAFKINQLTATTTLIDVEWDGPSKDGFYIPVAILEPVELGGSVIERAHLHNLDFIASKGLMYGSKIEILKSGDIIPKVIKVIDNPKGCTPIQYPIICKCCLNELIRDGVNLRCCNKNCANQVLRRITYFIKKLGVKHSAEATLDNFGIHTFKQLLEFVPDKKYKSEVTLYNEMLAKVFTRSKQELLAAMNFEGLSEKSINKIVEFYGFDNIEKGIYNGYPTGIGEATLSKFKESILENLDIVNKFINDSRYKFIEDTQKSPVNTIDIIGSVCFTGKLNTMSRNEAEKLASEHGYEVKGGVNKGLTYLVTNDPNSGSSKNRKAKELGTKVITEDDFLKLIKASEIETDLDSL